MDSIVLMLTERIRQREETIAKSVGRLKKLKAEAAALVEMIREDKEALSNLQDRLIALTDAPEKDPEEDELAADPEEDDEAFESAVSAAELARRKKISATMRGKKKRKPSPAKRPVALIRKAKKMPENKPVALPPETHEPRDSHQRQNLNLGPDGMEASHYAGNGFGYGDPLPGGTIGRGGISHTVRDPRTGGLISGEEL